MKINSECKSNYKQTFNGIELKSFSPANKNSCYYYKIGFTKEDKKTIAKLLGLKFASFYKEIETEIYIGKPKESFNIFYRYLDGKKKVNRQAFYIDRGGFPKNLCSFMSSSAPKITINPNNKIKNSSNALAMLKGFFLQGI